MFNPCKLSLVWKLFYHSVKLLPWAAVSRFSSCSQRAGLVPAAELILLSFHSWFEFLFSLLASSKVQNLEFGVLHQIAFERSLLKNFTCSKFKCCVLLLFRSGNVKGGSLVACAFSPSGNLFVTGSSSGDLTIWDDKMRCLYNEKAHDLGVTCCDISSHPVSG